MEAESVSLARGLVTQRYLDAGAESLRQVQREVRSVLAQRRAREAGLPDAVIEALLHTLALMDSNNFAAHASAGEREGRVVCEMVRRRHYGLSHGVGRSGDLASDQPKAAGSTLLYRLTDAMLLDFVRAAGLAAARAACVVPMATGMTIALALRAVHAERCGAAEGEAGECRYVLWPRVDQKTALKSVEAAGFTPWPVALRPAPLLGADGRPRRRRDARETPHPYFLQLCVDDVEAAMEAVGGARRVLCVLATTSCFAPRLPDPVLPLARLCRRRGVPLVVNNAYGVQSRPVMRALDAACREGRVDYVVQSGDKNFLVPVGGAVLVSPDERRVAQAAAVYAGRASAAPVVDLFITALSLGRAGMRRLWDERYALLEQMRLRLRDFAARRGEVLIEEGTRRGGGGAVPADSAGNNSSSGGSDGSSSRGEGSRPGATAGKGAKRRDRKRRGGDQCRNDISLAITVRHYWKHLEEKSKKRGSGGEEKEQQQQQQHPSPDVDGEHEDKALLPRRVDAARHLGAALFRSGVTGPRVVFPAPDTATVIVQQQQQQQSPSGCSSLPAPKTAFYSYGTHDDAYLTCPLLVCACAIGMTAADVEGLMTRLESLWPAP